MTSERISISSGGPWEAGVGYSRAVRVGRHVHVSGSTAMTASGLVGAGDPYAQAMQTLQTIERALIQAGARLTDVVRTRVYLVRVADWPEVARAHAEVFATIRPASTLLVVAALIDPSLLVEIEAEAIIADANTNT